MKQSFIYLMTLSLGLSMPVHAGDTFLKAPDAPKYETCELITHDNGNGGTFQTQDKVCLDRNTVLRRNYNAMVEAYNRSTRMISTDASTTVKPAVPQYETCTTVDNGNGGSYADWGCQSRNQAKEHDYNIQNSAWNTMQTQLAAANQQSLKSEAERQAAALQSSSATEALRIAADKNQQSAQKSSMAATITMALSVAAGVKFAITCIYPSVCQYPYLAASIAFAMMSAKNSRQANANENSGYSACQAQSSLSGSTGSCVSPTPYTTPKVDPTAITKNFDSSGNCIATEKTVCTTILSSLPAGTNIKDTIRGLSSFASAPPFKFNSDGTITGKNGKIYKPSDFTSAKSMMDAGFTADQASQAMAALGKSGSAIAPGLDKAKDDLKSTANADKLAAEFGGVSISGSGSGSGGGDKGAGSSSGTLGSHSIDGSGGAGSGSNDGRNPAGEGLTRDFNGEAIGSAGDDIFSMMNRRYKMKTAQDSFISN